MWYDEYLIQTNSTFAHGTGTHTQSQAHRELGHAHTHTHKQAYTHTMGPLSTGSLGMWADAALSAAAAAVSAAVGWSCTTINCKKSIKKRYDELLVAILPSSCRLLLWSDPASCELCAKTQ